MTRLAGAVTASDAVIVITRRSLLLSHGPREPHRAQITTDSYYGKTAGWRVPLDVT